MAHRVDVENKVTKAVEKKVLHFLKIYGGKYVNSSDKSTTFDFETSYDADMFKRNCNDVDLGIAD